MQAPRSIEAKARLILPFCLLAIAAVAIFNLLVPQDLTGDLLQCALLAAAAVIAGLLANRAMFARGAFPARESAVIWASFYVIIIAGFGIGAFLAYPDHEALMTIENGKIIARYGMAAVICLCTAVFEEVLMRGLAFPTLAFLAGRKGPLSMKDAGARTATLVGIGGSSLLFALLHIDFGGMASSGDAMVWLSALAKLCQALIFGVIMCLAYLRSGSLRSPIAIHGLFDFMYLGPTMACANSAQMGYLTSDAGAIVAMLVVALLMLPALRSLIAGNLGD